MSKFILIVTATSVLLFTSSFAFSKTPAKPAKKATPPVVSTGIATDIDRNCDVDFATPISGNGYFTLDEKTFYLLANKGKRSKNKKSRFVKYTLYAVDLATYAAKPVLSLKHLPGAALVAFGTPLQGMSAMVFNKKRQKGCFEGKAKAVSISLSKSGKKAFKQEGNFYILRTTNGSVLANSKRNFILETDYSSYQTRNGPKVNKGERAIFYNPATNLLVAWRYKEPRGLLEYQGSFVTAKRRLALKPGDRLLQNGYHFGVARNKLGSNTIEIIEVSNWSGRTTGLTGEIKLPRGIAAVSSSVFASFRKKLAIVTGVDKDVRKRWRSVYIFDYVKTKLLEKVKLKGNKHFNYTDLSSEGNYAALEVVDDNTGKTLELKMINFDKKIVKTVKLGN